MKKQLISSLILLVIFTSSFSILYRTPRAVQATYVSGVITKDTVWSLVDSPFVLSNDVIVNPTATLTIEPGVQVRFGGSFSLTINGRIIANGTAERMILFTTNDPDKQRTWRTIEIRGSQPSLLINCIIEYAQNGTTLESGIADIEKCVYKSNSDNGIAVHAGTLLLQDNEISSNQGNGITIAGGDQIDVRKNIIRMNRDGIVLSDQPTGTISIVQNEISNNTGSGFIVETENFVNTVITENDVSSNAYGFTITTDNSTYLIHNYVSNNTVGLYYSGNGYHLTEFNDIYENGVGIGADSYGSVFVNATRNYWGDSTGPKHISLNPFAKGNSVVSNETNIDFLPFLAHPFAYNNTMPTATLWTDKVMVAPHQTVTFIGTDSRDDGNIWQYLFDFNDGSTSDWTTLTLFNHSYASTGTFLANLTVEDDIGSRSFPASTTINVVDLVPLDTIVTLSNSTMPFNGDDTVTVYVSTGGVSVANAGVSLFSVRGGTFEPQSGLTDEQGYFTSKFTAPNVTQATDVRVIARASLTGYADGSDYKYVRVLPPLKIQVSPLVTSIWSEETITLNTEITSPLGEPVEGVDIMLYCTDGNLSTSAAITDSGGRANFKFTAPRTLVQTNVTVTIRTSKSEYADTESQTHITIEPKRLALDIMAMPSQVFSADASTIEVLVSFNQIPISGASVTIDSELGGNFSAKEMQTDSSGIARVTYMAPSTSMADGINVTIRATAGMDGFLTGENQTTVTVKPKEMSLEIISLSNTTYSGTDLSIIVQATYNMTWIQNANITVSASNGTVAPTTAMTDKEGNATFVLTMPEVSESSNVTFFVSATKEGYLETTGQQDIPIEPKIFTFQLTPATFKAGQDETLTVLVTWDKTLVDAALITLSYSGGQPSTNVTDVNGTCSFVINAPQTPENQFNITLSAQKIGFKPKQVAITLNVLPEEGGLSWMTILIMVIPIVIVAVVVALIKMKVIVVSTKDDEAGSE